MKTVEVKTLSDLASGNKQLYNAIDEILRNGDRLVVLDCELDSNNTEEFNSFMKHLGILSDFSTNTLSQRFVNANNEKRASGTYISRERTEFSDEFIKLLEQLSKKEITKTDMAHKLRISRPTLDKWIHLYYKKIANQNKE